MALVAQKRFLIMKVTVVQAIPDDYALLGFAVVATASGGFSPLWAVKRMFYGFEVDELVDYEVEMAEKEGISVAKELNPPLILVQKTNDDSQRSILAAEVVKATKLLNVRNLLITSFFGLKSKINPNLFELLLKDFSSEAAKSHLDSISFLIPESENFYVARVVLSVNQRKDKFMRGAIRN